MTGDNTSPPRQAPSFSGGITFAEDVFDKEKKDGPGLHSLSYDPTDNTVNAPKVPDRRQSSFGNIANVFRFARGSSSVSNTHDPAEPFGPAPTERMSYPNAHVEPSRKMSMVDAFGFHNLRQRSLSFAPFSRPHIPKSSKKVRKPYHSTRLGKPIDKPWMKYRDPAQRWAKLIFWGLGALGVMSGIVVIYLGVRGIPTPGNLCLVMDDDFSGGINANYWSHEVRIDGFGNHEFEWTTADSNNSYVQDNTLYLVPTLTADVIGADAVVNGYTLNLTMEGTCTAPNSTDCAVTSNSSTGEIINPVQSARLITKNKVSIRYGKVEVIAKMPKGDWIWPAIWMMPEDDVYGAWPRSGEIDIAESRGNNQSYSNMGLNHVQTTLHWGPAAPLDSFWRTFGIAGLKRQGYDAAFHKFTLEWTDKYLWSYIDNRVNTVYKLDFDETFWSRGDYPQYFDNGTVAPTLLTNPWYSSGANSAPFDQSFYLLLDVAVGGTNGFFPDNLGGKPWLDSSLTPMKDFWSAKDKWYPTWPTDPKQRGLAVSSVKVWQKC